MRCVITTTRASKGWRCCLLLQLLLLHVRASTQRARGLDPLRPDHFHARVGDADLFDTGSSRQLSPVHPEPRYALNNLRKSCPRLPLSHPPPCCKLNQRFHSGSRGDEEGGRRQKMTRKINFAGRIRRRPLWGPSISGLGKICEKAQDEDPQRPCLKRTSEQQPQSGCKGLHTRTFNWARVAKGNKLRCKDPFRRRR